MLNESVFGNIKYIIYTPDDFDSAKKYPTVFHTHGAGTRGRDPWAVKNGGPLKEILEGSACPKDCIVVAPLCSEDTWFDVFESLIALCRHIHSLDFVDGDRFYATGTSMGGYAAVQLMMSCPELFAAGVICCGGGMYWNAGRLKHIPIQFFHGAQDKTVLPEESLHLCAKICKAGGNAKVTVYPNNDHNCWDDTYTNPEVYRWMLAQKRYASTEN